MRKLGSINRSPGKGFPPGTIMIMPTTAHDDDDDDDDNDYDDDD